MCAVNPLVPFKGIHETKGEARFLSSVPEIIRNEAKHNDNGYRIQNKCTW
jgi:hypothetical protein